MKNRSFKAQHLVEILFIFGFVVVIAAVTMSPLGNKIASMFKGVAVNENLAATQTELAGVVKDDAAFDTISNNIKTLENSSNQSAVEAAKAVKNILNTVGLINSGQNNRITDENIKGLAQVVRKNNNDAAETSGSLANIIASAAGSALSQPEKDALENVKININGNLTIENSDKLVGIANELIAGVKTALEKGILSKDVFKYEGSPVTEHDLATMNPAAILAKYYNTETFGSFFNVVLLAYNVKDTAKPLDELGAKISSFIDEFKLALAIK